MEKFFIAAVTSANQLGPKRMQRLLQHFGSAREAWAASEGDLLDAGLPETVVQSLLKLRQRYPNLAEEIQSRCEAKGIGLCSVDDEEYPELLRKIDDVPMLLYYRGVIEPTATRISIVGTREMTSYGRHATLEIAEDLAREGITIVSGGAIGIDTFAHRGALNGGRTVVVLGCGLEMIDSHSNRKMFERIIENGVLVSEYAPKVPPLPGQFPRRNRIIAGLSIGVVVVEAGETSGALNTAQHALNYGRTLFAVPGSIFAEKSKGCNGLIRADGALLVRTAGDILSALNFDLTKENLSDVKKTDVKPSKTTVKPSETRRTPRAEPEPELEGDEAAVFQALDQTPASLDDLLTRLDETIDKELSVADLSMILLNLNFKGLVIEDELGNYARR